jgi:hypothetical protein
MKVKSATQEVNIREPNVVLPDAHYARTPSARIQMGRAAGSVSFYQEKLFAVK